MKDEHIRLITSKRERVRTTREASGKKDRKTGMKSVNEGPITHKDMSPEEKRIARLHKKHGAEINNLNPEVENDGGKDITSRRKHQRLHLESQVREALIAHAHGHDDYDNFPEGSKYAQHENEYQRKQAYDDELGRRYWADWQETRRNNRDLEDIPDFDYDDELAQEVIEHRFNFSFIPLQAREAVLTQIAEKYEADEITEKQYEKLDPEIKEYLLSKGSDKAMAKALLRGRIDFSTIPMHSRENVLKEISKMYEKRQIPDKFFNALDPDIQHYLLVGKAKMLKGKHTRKFRRNKSW